MSIHDAIKSSTDPRELRIAIALADIRLQQLTLSAQMEDTSLEARGGFVVHCIRAGAYCAELTRKCCLPPIPLRVREASISEFLIGFFLGLFGAAVFAWMV